MTDNVTRVPSVVFTNPEPLPTLQPQPSADSAEKDHPRLTIEQSPTGFVYKVLDRMTGEVIRQIPQKSLADLAEDPSYSAGGFIKTSI